MVRVIVMRHGSRDVRAGNPGLTEAGRIQAARAADALLRLDSPVTAVYASPLARALETAGIIAGRLGLLVQPSSALRERANWGDPIEGGPGGGSFEEFFAIWQRASAERDWQPPLGDSSRAAGARLEQFMCEVVARHENQTVVAVTHGGLIGDYLANVLGEERLRGLCESYVTPLGPNIPECSFTVCVITDGSLHVERVGDAGHLVGGG